MDDGQFQSPEGLTVDKSGKVYVVDTSNQRTQVFAPQQSNDLNALLPVLLMLL
ncbi:hypothetical protein [Desulfovibrio inopinatus]|uniref:hypothetical protein n=1 Tax=Desulfovibrio inopinatus TaxID=102109 RepID=UPI003CCBF56F